MDVGRPDGHRYFEDMALSHVLGGLDESEGRVFRAHLLDCGDCRARVGELRALAHDLADVERDERRERAAKAVETKRRESEDDDGDPGEYPVSSRASRILVVVGLLLVILLAAWNFTLRGRLDDINTQIATAVEAQTVLQYGQAWSVEAHGVDATVSGDEQQGLLAILIDGYPDPDPVWLAIHQLNADGDITTTEFRQTLEGRLLHAVELRAGTVEIVVAATEPDASPTDTISGDRVLEATAPTTA